MTRILTSEQGAIGCELRAYGSIAAQFCGFSFLSANGRLAGCD